MLPKPRIDNKSLLSDELNAKFEFKAIFYPAILVDNVCHASSPNNKPKNREIRCEKCEKLFLSFKGLKQHMGKKHNPRKKYCTCPQCTKKFRTKYAVKFHLRQVHEKATRVFCEQCGVEFYNKYMLREHQRLEHVAI